MGAATCAACGAIQPSPEPYYRSPRLNPPTIPPRETPPAAEPWSCAQCKESIDGQFTECWSCGAPRA